MRISDWSSDVCSSDLKQAQAEESQGRRLGNLLQDKGCPGEGVVRDRQRIVYAGIEQAGGRAEETKARVDNRLSGQQAGDILVQVRPIGVLGAADDTAAPRSLLIPAKHPIAPPHLSARYVQ